jgi:hypothetical protein
MRQVCALIAAFAIMAGASYGQPRSTTKKVLVIDDPREMIAAALKLARSPDPVGHDELLRLLRTPDYLLRLDSPDEYRQTGRRLRIARIVEALANNQASSARNVFLSLTESTVFTQAARRVDFLILYSPAFRPAPSVLVAFWDRYSQPLDGFTPFTIEALTKNGTEPALQLLERKFADPSHPDDDKLYWMRSFLLPHRNEVPLLQTVERLLDQTLPPHLRPDLVEAIFDYQPDQWYSEAAVVRPPNRLEMSPEAKALLMRIGTKALEHVSLTPAQQATVKRALEGYRTE